MQEFLLNNTLGNFFVVLIVVLLFAQTYMLLRIRNVLEAMSLNFDSMIYFFRRSRKTGSTNMPAADTTLSTCQFCVHRLAYINTSKTKSGEDDFYHMCGLRNVHITLDDSCDQFEADEQMKP